MKNYFDLKQHVFGFNLLILLCAVIACAVFHACNHPAKSKPAAPSSNDILDFGTQDDSASYYFNQGWVYIMDYGLWDLSEQAFRKAITFDNQFQLGHALVGRISSDFEERTTIYTTLTQSPRLPNAYNQLLLTVYLNSIKKMNARDSQDKVTEETIKRMRQQSMTNMSAFIEHYPDAHYIKAEYIETIHVTKGPQAALDSMPQLMTAAEYTIPFFIGYKAVLYSELGDYATALKYAEKLAETINPESAPAPHVVYAQIYFHMKRISSAYDSILKAVQLDPKHLIAQALKRRIEEAM